MKIWKCNRNTSQRHQERRGTEQGQCLRNLCEEPYLRTTEYLRRRKNQWRDLRSDTLSPNVFERAVDVAEMLWW